MSAWTPEREAELTRAWNNVPVRDIAVRMQTSVGAIYRQARKIGLKTTRRSAPPALSTSHPAIRGRLPRHARRLVDAETSPGLFVSGRESRKIGRRVTVGAWKGLPFYTLTLAERMTCPRSCLMWRECYGNNLNWPRRHLLDHALIERMRWELTALAARHPDGLAIRLHILGDFGSDENEPLAIDYATAWRDWIRRFPGLHVFGFTAWAPESAVGRVIDQLNAEHADRWRVRFSGHALAGRGATVIETAADSQHVICPWDAGKVANCGACGLCWKIDRTIEFVRH